MILIGGRSVEDIPDTGGYSANALERSIFDIMAGSGSAYRYDSEEQLLFELRLRDSLVTAARELNHSGMSFKVFRDSMANPAYWQRTAEGGFLLKDGVRPSDAIADIYENGYLYGTECATAMIIVYYRALLDVFPKELYNRLYSDIYLMDWQHLDRDLALREYDRADDDLPGDTRYFINPDVNPLHPEWQGENVFDLGRGRYYGHGMGIADADTIVDALNSARREGATRSAYLLDHVKRQDIAVLWALRSGYESQSGDGQCFTTYSIA